MAHKQGKRLPCCAISWAWDTTRQKVRMKEGEAEEGESSTPESESTLPLALQRACLLHGMKCASVCVSVFVSMPCE